MGDLDNRTNHDLFAHHDRLRNTSADLIYRPYFRHHYVGQRESGTAAMAALAAGIDEAAAGGFSAEILTAAPAEAAPAEAAPTATPNPLLPLLLSSPASQGRAAHPLPPAQVLAFGPRVALHATHGSFIPTASQAACAAAVRRSLAEMRGSAAVHVGTGNLVDMQQVALVRGSQGLVVTEHDTFHHNVPMYLEREGLLVSLFKRELIALLRPAGAALSPSHGD